MSRALYIAGVNLLVAAVLLVLVEGCVRATHPEIGPLGTDKRLVADSIFGEVPGPRPGASGKSNGARFEVGSTGFWKYSGESANAEAAWLLLGDSVTMGMGVDPDHTFGGLLAERLRDVAILNPSLIGYASDHYVKVLEAVLDRRGDVRRVSIIWCLNDAYSPEAANQDPDQAVRRLTSPLLRFIHRHLYTYQWLKAALFDRPRRYFEHDVRLYRDGFDHSALADLERVAAICADENLMCEIVLLPYEYQLRAADRDDVFLPQQRLKDSLSHLRVPVYDAAPYLLENSRRASNLYLFGDGIHLSREGHRLVADFLSELPTS